MPFPAGWVTKNGFAAINPDPNSLVKYPTTTIMLFEAPEPEYAIGDILLMRIDTQTVLREYKGLDVFRADFEHRDTIGKTGIVLGRLVAEFDV